MLKMVYLGFMLLFFCFDFAFSDKFCKSENQCKCVLSNDSVIDLSSVGSLEFPRFYEVLFLVNCSVDEIPISYSYNPCFAFDSPDQYAVPASGHKPCKEASACIKGFGGASGTPPEQHAIGLQHTAVFGESETHPYINYTVPDSKTVPLQVLLECGSSDDHTLSMIEPECPDGKKIVLMLTSKCACPDGCKSVIPTPSPSGLSLGSKLLIAFFTILLAYLLIGIIWNFCNGAHGAELIPNFEFWNGLPTLIMEGVVFTFSCCGRQRSYGEV